MSEQSTTHSATLRNQDKLNRLATERFRVVGGKVEKYKAKPPQDIAAVIAAAEEREHKERERILNPGIGDSDERGIFLGAWTPQDSDGTSLRQTFNVFAAPHDVRNTPGKKESCNYLDAVKHVGSLKNWNGFDGENYDTDKDLIQALKDGTYKGGWVIPPREVLMGENADGVQVQPDNLYAHWDKGALKGSFVKEANESHGSLYADRYWSSTESQTKSSGTMKDKRYMYSFHFGDGVYFNVVDDYNWQSCRPIRLELARLEPKP